MFASIQPPPVFETQVYNGQTVTKEALTATAKFVFASSDNDVPGKFAADVRKHKRGRAPAAISRSKFTTAHK